jgi:NTP pyrophosphatase (non-canonical NTP hydrolase)
MLTFGRLTEANVVRAEESFHRSVDEWSPSDWATACAGEMGEALNKLKKLRRRYEDPSEATLEERREVGFELADTVIYIDLLCTRMKIDLGTLVEQKFNITSDTVGSAVKL